ncbi:hypothetical protein ACFO3Q_15445, partial [Coralloluteibacterium thermophilus]
QARPEVLSPFTTVRDFGVEPAVRAPKTEPTISNVQRERMILLDILESPHNLSVADYAKLAGKSRRWITYEVTAGNLLSISLGNRGQRVPDWQLDPLKRRLVQTILKQTARGVDPWEIYHALTQPYDEFGGQSPIEAVTLETLEMAVQVVRRALLIQQIDGPLPRREGGTTRSSALA